MLSTLDRLIEPRLHTSESSSDVTSVQAFLKVSLTFSKKLNDEIEILEICDQIRKLGIEEVNESETKNNEIFRLTNFEYLFKLWKKYRCATKVISNENTLA
jgi:hypothetical protein